MRNLRPCVTLNSFSALKWKSLTTMLFASLFTPTTLFMIGCASIVILFFILYFYSQMALSAFEHADFQFHGFSKEKKYVPPLLKNAGSMGIKLSLVAPAYNEEKRIERMLHVTCKYLNRRYEERGDLYEVIVVNDGSKDQTLEVVDAFAEAWNQSHRMEANESGGPDDCYNDVRIVNLPQNKGKGFAVKTGCLRARGEKILMLDADAATKISDLEKLETELDLLYSRSKCRHGIALGSRRQETSNAERVWYRKIESDIFNFLVRFVAGIGDVKDTQCGFKMFDRQAARYLFYNQHVERWCFDVDLLILSKYGDIPTVEVPVNWKEVDGSHLNLGGMIGIIRDLFLIRLYYILRFWKIEKNF